MYRYDVGLPVNAGDRRDVADEIETKLVIERGVDGIPTADHEQRVSVCGRAHDGLGADIAAAARSVLDNKLLTEPLRQPLTHQTRDDVGRTGWSERHDDAHRSQRIGLRPRHARQNRQRGGAGCQMQKLSAGKFHSITTSAMASSLSGTVSPTALAVNRLMASSNLVGCSTGRSPAFAPRRILS